MGIPVIFLIEDDTADIELARVALAEVSVPHELIVVGDGREALARLQAKVPFEKRKKPSLVLLDLKIPQLSGLELLRQLKEDPQTRTIPVVVWSGTEDPAAIAAVYGAFANAFIHKPSDLGSFTQSLRMSAEYWLGQVQQVE